VKLAVLAVAVALLASPAAAIAGACARIGIEPQVVTHAGDVVPKGGGVLVGWQRATGDGEATADGADPAFDASWRLRSGKKKLATRAVQLAPGLAVYTPKRALKKKSRLTLHTGKTRLGRFTFGTAAGAVLAPPNVQEVSFAQHQSPRGGTSQSTRARLVGAVPDGAVAVIVYRVTARGTQALSWNRVEAGVTEAVLYTSPGRCGVNPPEMQPATEGESVELRWVDAFGRRSEPSARITVVKSP
jgi:hypothetical protein